MSASNLRGCFLAAISVVLLMPSGTGCTNELKKTRHLSKGEKEFEAGRYEQAEIEYLNVLKAASRNPIAIRQLGIIYQEEGNLARARQYLTAAVQLEPNNLEVHLKLAINALSVTDYKQAIQEANWVLTKKPGQIEALEVLAGTATNSAAVQPLIEHIQKLRKADTDRASYHVALGDLALRTGSVTNAEAEFKQALALDPKCSAAHGRLATVFLSRKEIAAAEQEFKSAAELSPVRSLWRLKYAEFQLLTGKLEEGKRSLDQITKETPDYLPAWQYLARVAFTEKRYDDCRSIVQRVLAKQPWDYEALMLNGNIQVAKGDSAKAISEFGKMAKEFPNSPQVQFQLARAYLMTNETAKATACLEKAVTLDKNFTDAVLLLAQLKIQRGIGDQAIPLLTELIKKEPQLPQPYLLLAEAYLVTKNVDQAIPLLTELIKKQPQFSQPYLLLAEAYFAKNDLDQALAVCRNMAEAFPKSPEVPMLIGSLFVRQNKPDEARKAFEKSLELSPGLFAPVEQLVNLDMAQHKFAEATARVQAEMDKHPQAPEPWVVMARIHLVKAQAIVDAENKNRAPGAGQLRIPDVPATQPELGEAEAALRKAMDLNSAWRTPYLMLSEVYAAAARQQQALECLNGLLAKTNDVEAWMKVGAIQDGLKNYPAARDAYEKALSLSPDNSPVLNNLAFLYAERFNELDKAYQMAEKARQLLPKHPSTADTLGWVLYRRGEYNRAVKLLEESVSQLPDEPELQFHLGVTHYMLGNENPARQALQKAVQSSKQFEGKEQAAQSLAVLEIDPKNADAAAVSTLAKHLQENPKDPIALERMGAIQERDGAFEKAAATYETALKTNPQDTSLTLKLAQLYSTRLNDPQKALALAKSAHDLAPDDARISALLGRMLSHTGDFKWALSLLEESARKAPGDPEVAFDLGWAYYSVGRVFEAQNLMQTASKARSTFAKADQAARFVTLIAAAKDSSSAQAALPDAQKILATETNYVPALMILGITQETHGNKEQAVKTYNQVLSQLPMFTPASRNLGLLYFAHNSDEKAYDLLTKAREAFPQDPQVAKAFGILNYKKANYPRAVQLLNESAQTLNQDAEVLYYLGKAQYQLKSKSESKASLQKALEFNLQAKLAEDAKRVLSEIK